MRHNRKHRSPTIGPTINGAFVARMVGYIVAPAFIAPALYYNLDWSPSGRLWDNVWSGGLIVAGAVAVEACRYVRTWWAVLLALIIATLLMVNNSFNAFENLSNAADHSADHRRASMVGSETQWSARSEWSVKVGAARKVAGDRLTSDLQAEAEKYVAENARRWQATKECDPQHVTSSAAFCAEAARLKGLARAAKDRDTAEAEVRKIDGATLGKVVPTNADPFVANMVQLLGVFGIEPTPEGRKGIRSLKSALKTVAIEAVATFMPMLWLALMDGLILAASRPRAAPLETDRADDPPAQRASATLASIAPTPNSGPESKCNSYFARFCADELEQGSTFSAKPTEAYQVWREWCARRGLEPGTQKKFGGMMGTQFARDRNHGYPRYLGVRLRPALMPALRLAVSN